ncbi:MAG: type II toxin-antitoxin system RelE/ParE family toxin [Thermoleophilia bacterium]|nr:type II toxin-antitoxin system RelE/ParE family toxin [Thermoleophilia bacterium]
MDIEFLDTAEYVKWMRGLGAAEQSKVASQLELLAARGEELRLPHVRWLGRGLFELRVVIGQQPRLYFHRVGGDLVVMLTFGRKDTQQRDIARARRRMP